MSRKPVTLIAFVKPSAPAQARTQRAAARAAAEAEHRVLVDVDGAAPLDAAAIGELVSILREVREAGGDMVLVTGLPGVRETLSVMGLDRVFAVMTPDEARAAEQAEDETAESPHRGTGRTRARFAAIAAVLLAVAAGTAVGSAVEAPEPADIVQHVVDANPSLRSYEARVHVDVHLVALPFVSPKLDGTTYFKRPDNFEVVFDSVPSYAKGFERLYSDIGDPTGWEKRFNMTVTGEKDVDGHRDLVLRLVQKVRGMIDHQDVAVDPSSWRIDEMEWHYYNGGVISMTQEFTTLNGLNVLSTQHASIRIPHVHATAVASYSDYKTNVAIDDSVFTKAAK